MKEETKMHMPEGVEPVEDAEQKVPVQVIILTLALFIAAIFGALSFLGDKVPHNPFTRGENSSEQNGNGETSADTLAAEEAARQKFEAEEQARERAAMRETLVGVPILVTDTAEKKFVRLSIKDKGIVSVGVDENTKNQNDGSVFALSNIQPGKELTITALRLPDTEMYDYLAETITVDAEIPLSVEERTRKISENALKMMNAN